MKKIIALLLSLTMIMSMTTAAFAEEASVPLPTADINASEANSTPAAASVPVPTTSVPAAGEPTESESAPPTNESVASESTSLPAVSESVPASSTSVPTVSESAPATSESTTSDSVSTPAVSEPLTDDSVSTPTVSESASVSSGTSDVLTSEDDFTSDEPKAPTDSDMRDATPKAVKKVTIRILDLITKKPVEGFVFKPGREPTDFELASPGTSLTEKDMFGLYSGSPALVSDANGYAEFDRLSYEDQFRYRYGISNWKFPEGYCAVADHDGNHSTHFTAEDGKVETYYLIPAPDNTRFPLRITVRDARTFKPVEGLKVEPFTYNPYIHDYVSRGKMVADANGYCEISDLVVGSYSLRNIVMPKGYSGFDKPIEERFERDDATPVEMTWYLTPDPDTDDTRYITGQKLDENGNPIAGAVYRMTGRDLAGKDVPPRTATTDANGKILFDNVSLWDDPTITVSEITQNSEYVLTKDITKVFDINKMWEPCGLDFVDRAKRAIKTTGISLSDAAISLNAAGTKKLTATSTPANTTDKPVVWQSSDPAVATVSDDGTVTGVSSGIANITVTAAERPGISKTCKVSVTVPVESVNITDYSVSLLKGNTKQLYVSVYPENATDKAVAWSSDNTAVATVSGGGIVTAKSAGTANITATSTSNKSAKSSCTVTVTSNEVVDITLSAYDVSIVKGDSTTIYATVMPNDAIDKNITWTSSNNSVATVSNGTIKALKEGSTTITARASNGIQKTCSVSVVTDAVDVTVVRLHPSAYTMDIGESSRVSVEIAPYNATNRNIAWTSSNSSVATVDNGVVTAVSAGNARITATAHNGVSAFYDVSVRPKESERIDVTNVQLSTPSATLMVGNNFNLVATLEPANASDLGILWSSSDSNVVSLTHGGDIKAVNPGVATVTATAHNGIKASCTITVITSPTPPKPVETGVAGFVERLYTEVLGRASDADGKANWIRQLQSKANTGAQAAQGFVTSVEMKARGLSNEEFLKVMYRTFFNRDPDSGGFSAWMGNLNNGISREFVLCGFANSAEFTAVCNQFGIERGTITSTQPRDKSGNLTSFVNRLYTKLLDRQGEEDGLNAWTNQILSGAQTPQQVAHGFVFSKEFESKNLNNEKYVEYMYRTFMGREYDAGGKANWVKALNDGKGREYVFNGFANSVEFANIVKSFGL